MGCNLDTIITGDCLDVLPALASESVDLVVTSPPYPGQKNDTHTVDEWLAWFAAVVAALHRVLTPVGVLVLNIMFKRTPDGWFDGRLFTALPAIVAGQGFNWIDTYPWVKPNPAPNVSNAHRRSCDTPGWEPIFVFTRAARIDDYQFDFVRRPYSPKSISSNGRAYSTRGGNFDPHPDGARQPNWLMVSSSGSSRTKTPRALGQSFPIAIPERFILQHTQPGDVVLDPFCGAGTTCRAAQENGRHYIGIELLPGEAARAAEWLQRPYQMRMAM